jgi:transcriptional regulator with XRE-family HTH domain
LEYSATGAERCQHFFTTDWKIVEATRIDLKKLGERVRFLRQGKGWSQGKLAEESGVPKAYISDLENGEAGKPNIQYVYSIAVALDVTLDDLLNNAAPKQSRVRKERRDEELPPGLAELQHDLHLSDVDVEMLSHLNFRGHRPKDKEGWRFLWDAIKVVSQRPPQE